MVVKFVNLTIDIVIQFDNMCLMTQSIRYDRSIIDSLRAMAVFAKVVEHGSFKKAAKCLALSPSVVSHHISRLEETIGKQLLYRTTRNISLTADGTIFLNAANEMLQSATQAFEEISSKTHLIAGELQVALPTVLSRAHFLKMTKNLEEQFPLVTLSFSFSDRIMEHIKEGFDVALVMEDIKGMGLMRRKLATVSRVIVCAPTYFKSTSPPLNLQDIKNSDWIWPNALQNTLNYVDKSKDDSIRRVTITPRMIVDNSMACRRLAIEGIGLTVIPEFVVQEDLEAGRLIQALPEIEPEKTNLYAIWPRMSNKLSLTHIFVDFVSKNFSSQ